MMLKRAAMVVGSTALVFGGWLAGSMGCGSAKAGGAGGGAGSGGDAEPTVFKVACSVGQNASHSFPGKSKEWIAINVTAVGLHGDGSWSQVPIGADSEGVTTGVASTECMVGVTGVEFLQR